MSEIAKKFVTSEHPVYAANKDQWTRDETAYRGGPKVREKYLQAFYWEELADSDHFKKRQAAATYVNFGHRMALRFVGHLSPEAPKPEQGINMGSLGPVRELDKLTDPLTLSELVWYNIDGRNRSMTSFFDAAQRWTMVTGHRWVGVEAPTQAAETEADVLAGSAPYAVSLSPLQVPNWVDGYDGRLLAMVIKVDVRQIVKDGKYSGETVPEYVMYVAAGYEEIGEEYTAGGWWRFNEKGEPIKGEGGEELAGDLNDTEGAIPYTVFYYEQDDENMSISGMSDVNSISISYMNLSSAGDNDAIEGGGRTLYVLGTNKDAFNQTIEVKKKGGRLVPVEIVVEGEKIVRPEIYDSASVSASSAIEASVKRKKAEGDQMTDAQLNTAPESSGEARKAEFRDAKQPRLSLMARNRETTEQFIVNMFARRLGKTPDASVVWKKEFDLSDPAEDWQDIFSVLADASIESPTLTLAGLKGLVQGRGIILDDALWSAIESEIKNAADEKARFSSVLAGLSGGDGASEEPKPTE